MQNKKIKVKFNVPLEYVFGYLRYGHKEGILELLGKGLGQYIDESFNLLTIKNNNINTRLEKYFNDNKDSLKEFGIESIDDFLFALKDAAEGSETYAGLYAKVSEAVFKDSTLPFKTFLAIGK